MGQSRDAHLGDAALARLASGAGSAEEAAAAARHLAGCADCLERSRSVEAAIGVTPVVEMAVEPDAHPLRPVLPRGTVVGRYLILQAVGEGGMGVVYAAYDPELERKVALKLLRATIGPGTGQPDSQARLLREAQAMARVSHPNVTTVHDVGTFGDQVFLAMDLVEGTNFKHWLMEAKRPWREVLGVLLAAGRGLAAAHAVGLVHRDFKPENVLVGGDGRVKVTDFGLARLEGARGLPLELQPEAARGDAAGRLHSPLTQAGSVVGTPSYMAPEQHQGHPPDARSDQFSFCVVLYSAVYGKRPFELRRLVAAALEGDTGLRSFASRLVQPPPRESRVPFWVRRALMRGLALDPARRFASMNALLERLSRPPITGRRLWVAALGLTVLVGSAHGLQRALSHQGELCSGAELRLSGVWDAAVSREVESAFQATGAPYAMVTFQSVKSVLDRYARGWAAMHADACQATRMRGEQTEAALSLRMACLDRRLNDVAALTSLLRQADQKRVNKALEAANALPPVAGCADLEALATAIPPPEEPAARAEAVSLAAQLGHAEALRNAGLLKSALELARPTVEAARRLHYPPLLADALVQQGEAQMRDLDAKGAEQSFTEAWRTAEEGRNDEARIRAAVGMGFVEGELLGQFSLARLWIEMGMAARARLGNRPDLDLRLLHGLAVVLSRQGRFQESLDAYERVLALSDRTRGPRHFGRVPILNNLSVAYGQLGRVGDEVRVLEEALELSDSVLGPHHPTSVYIDLNLADTYLELGDLARADVHAKAALLSQEQGLGLDHPSVGNILDSQGSILLAQKRYPEALETSLRSVALIQKVRGPEHPALARPLTSAGEACVGLGRTAEALPYFERALSLGNPEPAIKARLGFDLARALFQTGGDLQRARSLAAQARKDFSGVGKQQQAAEVARWLAARWH